MEAIYNIVRIIYHTLHNMHRDARSATTADMSRKVVIDILHTTPHTIVHYIPNTPPLRKPPVDHVEHPQQIELPREHICGWCQQRDYKLCKRKFHLDAG